MEDIAHSKTEIQKAWKSEEFGKIRECDQKGEF